MCAKGLFLFFLFAVVTSNCVVYGRLKAEGQVGGTEDDTKVIVLQNRRILDYLTRRPPTKSWNKCSANITSKNVEITQDYLTVAVEDIAKDQHCVWHFTGTSEKHRFVLYYLKYTSTAVDRNQYDDYYGAPELSVYDGPEVDESKRLFRLGEPRLYRKQSTGPNMTIVLDYKLNRLFQHQQIVMKVAKYKVH